MGRRCIGLDVHREFAQVAVWEDGRVRQAGKIDLTAEALRAFCDSLGPQDEVAVEATCNTHAIVRLIEPRVARVVVSNPQKTRAIAEAKVKTDKVDAAILAECWQQTFCRRCGWRMRPRTRCVARSRDGRTSSVSAPG
jgi:transposase